MPVPRHIPMSHHVVFSKGAYATVEAEPETVYEPKNPNPEQKRCPDTGMPMWKVVVTDAAATKAKDKTVTVKILSVEKPELPPAMPGTPFHLVEFIGLEAYAYAQVATFDGKPRAVQQWSFRAEGMKAPEVAAPPVKSTRATKSEAA